MKRKELHNWNRSNFTYSRKAHVVGIPSFVDTSETSNHIDFFKLYLDKNLIDVIIEETNRKHHIIESKGSDE